MRSALRITSTIIPTSAATTISAAPQTGFARNTVCPSSSPDRTRARAIVIDSALAADRCTGCRNFTIAHEAAHQILADLFPNDYGKAVKCRGHIAYRERNGKPSWEEWQADTLAAELLMPTFLINAEIERVALAPPNGILYKSVSDPNYEKILEMARRIGVSWSAIRIRLQQMQVIKGKPIHCHPLDIMRFGE